MNEIGVRTVRPILIAKNHFKCLMPEDFLRLCARGTADRVRGKRFEHFKQRLENFRSRRNHQRVNMPLQCSGAVRGVLQMLPQSSSPELRGYRYHGSFVPDAVDMKIKLNFFQKRLCGAGQYKLRCTASARLWVRDNSALTCEPNGAPGNLSDRRTMLPPSRRVLLWP